MSFQNPTPFRIGKVGTLFGKRYRVAGRVVLGMEQAGAIYYWHEFNLVNLDGESATLVFEPDDQGGAWRLFTYFEPECPITAQDAATKSVGEPINLDGTDVRVTLIAESRVYHIEGEAPEGVEIGDIAHYFNAEGPESMYVVSWTGEEVECYRGATVPYETIRSCFNLSKDLPSRTGTSLEPPVARSSVPRWLKGLAVFFVFAAVVAVVALWSTRRNSARAMAVSAPGSLPLPVGWGKGRDEGSLPLGSTGTLKGTAWHVRTRSIVEIDEVGRRFLEYEYHLQEDGGSPALLIHGLKPAYTDWFLFKPVQSPPALTPEEAAGKRTGERVEVEGNAATVTQLFQAIIRQTDSAEAADIKSGTILYGFIAETGSTLLLARWNDRGITFYRGESVPAKAVVGCFR